jgi:putative ABC transport system permease protein
VIRCVRKVTARHWKPRYFFNEWSLGRLGKSQTQSEWRRSTEIHRAASDKFFPTADSRSARLQANLAGEAGLDLYASTEQFFAPEAFVVVRARGDAPSLLPAVKRAIARIDPELGVYDVALMQERLNDTTWRQRLVGILFAVFATLALLLASVGVYGVMSYAVGQRTREMGIRTALGAHPRDVLRLILSEGLKLALAGAGIGFFCALLLARAVSHLLYGVSANDPLFSSASRWR